MSKVVVLLSGGMDSTTLAAMTQAMGHEVHAINFYYGQKHHVELECAQQVAGYLGLASYDLINIDGVFQNSSLLEGGPEIDDNQDKASVGATFVPARNSVLLSIAAGRADAIGAHEIYYGAHAEDHAGYPDCRPEYYEAISKALSLGTVNAVRVVAPFILYDKSHIVQTAWKYRAPLHLTHSCYRGERPQCGTCPTCQLRIEAFKKAGFIDPVPYATDVDWTGCRAYEI